VGTLVGRDPLIPEIRSLLLFIFPFFGRGLELNSQLLLSKLLLI
jgi:hypothetical protein